MKAIEIRDLEFKYMGQEKPALRIQNFVIETGETVLITGKSGSGKSTLVNIINGIIPSVIHGTLSGTILLNGMDQRKMKVSDISKIVGTLLQDPERQVLSFSITDEISFGPENLNLPVDEIDRRVKLAIEKTGISDFLERETTKLSGGELQRVALASVLAMEPEILILDEPTSNIDPDGTEKIFEFLKENKNRITMVLVEHKVERAFPFVDRIVVVDDGEIKLDVHKSELLQHIEILLNAGIEIPEEYIYAYKLGLDTVDINTVKKKIFENDIKLSHRIRNTQGDVILKYSGKVKVEGHKILEASLAIREGEIYCIMGKNGAGKTTLIKSIMDFLDRRVYTKNETIYYRGEDISSYDYADRGRYIAYLPQSFDLMLINRTVEDEIYFSGKMRKIKGYKDKGDFFIKMFSLEDKRKTDPLSLSTGQRRRVCMGASLSSSADIILMDEPTSGQDFYHKKILGEELRTLSSQGYSFIIVTHDSRFAYRYSDRIGILSEGKIIHEGEPEEVFLKSSKYHVLPPSDFLLRYNLEDDLDVQCN